MGPTVESAGAGDAGGGGREAAVEYFPLTLVLANVALSVLWKSSYDSEEHICCKETKLHLVQHEQKRKIQKQNVTE